MPPAKHGKNATANPVYSQYERRKDNDSEGYGTQKRRAATLSMQPFDCCHLSSQPAKTPVITPDGYLYDKGNILENLLHQKQEMKSKAKEYERQRAKYAALETEEQALAEQKRLEDFRNAQKSATPDPSRHFEAGPAPEVSEAGKMLAMKKETIQTEKGKVVPKMPSFWIPAYTPGAKPTEVKPPPTKTTCPMSGKPLKMKDLIPVKWTLADKHSTVAIEARKERYVCAATHKPLSNAVPAVVLRKSGHVITKEAYERLVKPDMIDPITGDKLTEADIIPMKSSGTGFAERGGDIKKLKTAAAQVA